MGILMDGRWSFIEAKRLQQQCRISPDNESTISSGSLGFDSCPVYMLLPEGHPIQRHCTNGDSMGGIRQAIPVTDYDTAPKCLEAKDVASRRSAFVKYNYLSVSQDPAPQIALHLLLLWRANMESGSPQPAQEPIVPMEAEPKSASKSTSPPAAQTTKIPALSSNKSDTGEGWTKLADFQTVSGTKPPPELKFANGEKADTRHWSWVLGEIADYLARNGLLKSGDCPLTTGTTTNRYLVNTSPMYFDGTKFHNQRRLSNGLYLDTGFSAHDCVRFGRYLLEHCDQDPAQVWLKTG